MSKKWVARDQWGYSVASLDHEPTDDERRATAGLAPSADLSFSRISWEKETEGQTAKRDCCAYNQQSSGPFKCQCGLHSEG